MLGRGKQEHFVSVRFLAELIGSGCLNCWCSMENGSCWENVVSFGSYCSGLLKSSAVWVEEIFFFFLVPLWEKIHIELRGFKTGMALRLCIILGGRNRKTQENVDQVRYRCVVVFRWRSLLAFFPLVGRSFKTS